MIIAIIALAAALAWLLIETKGLTVRLDTGPELDLELGTQPELARSAKPKANIFSTFIYQDFEPAMVGQKIYIRGIITDES